MYECFGQFDDFKTSKTLASAKFKTDAGGDVKINIKYKNCQYNII